MTIKELLQHVNMLIGNDTMGELPLPTILVVMLDTQIERKLPISPADEQANFDGLSLRDVGHHKSNSPGLHLSSR